MEFLSKIENDSEKKCVKQLIARYEVNNSFDYMGNYSSANIKNWIFDYGNDYNDEEYKNQCSQYENDYGELKNLLKQRISVSKYYYTTSNLAWYPEKYWYSNWEPKRFSKPKNYETQILQLLELIKKGYIFVGYNENCDAQIITNLKNIILYNRKRQTNAWDGELKYFLTDMLYWTMETFVGLKKARADLDGYNKLKSNDKLKLFYPNECKIKSIKYEELEPIFKWLAVYEKLKEIKITLGKIESFPTHCHESDVITFIKKFIGEDVYVCYNKIAVENKGKNFVSFVTNLKSDDDKAKIYIKQSQNSELVTWTYNGNEKNEEKFLIVYSSVNDEQRILAEILKILNYGDDTCQYIHNFIQTGNITELSSREFKKFISQKRLSYEYPFLYEECLSESLNNDLSIDAIYTILAGEMSYNEHCPLCNSIPTLNIKEQEITRLEKRNTLIAMFTAQYKDKDIYIKILCCKSCFEQYKLTLTSVDIKEGEDGFKILKLTQKVMDSMRSRKLITEIKISPDNWRIIELFNGLA